LDPVAYRNAVVGNILGGFTYTNIRNFEYGVRGKIGGEYHMALEDPVWEPAFAPSIDGYNSEWGTYDNRAVFECHAVNRLQYRIHFSKEYEGWKRVFNVLNRLEIIPQYKLHFSMRKELMGPSETMDDPRDIRKDLEMDYDGDGKIDETLDNVGPRLDTVDAVSKRWDKYARNNTAYLLSVPLLRVDFKVAENTKLQLGYQWLREYDIISPESNLSGHAFLAQIVSKASYKGYSVTFFLGGKYWLSNYDVNQRDAVIDVGSMYDRRGYEFFAKIFSGI